MELTKEKKAAVVALLLFVILAGLATYYLVINKTNQVVKETLDIFTGSLDVPTYVDINGNPVQLEEYLGKVLVVTTFASWSPFSSADLAILNEQANTFANQEVVFIAINRKESREQVQRYIATIPNYESIHYVIDVEDRFYLSVGGYAMPETLIFDEKGIIAEHIRGSLKAEEIEVMILQTIAD